MFPNVHTDKTSCQLISQLLIVIPHPRLTAKFIYSRRVSYFLGDKMPQPLLSSGSWTQSIKMTISTKSNGQNYCVLIFIVSTHADMHAFFNNFISHLEVLGLKRVIWTKFHSKDPQTLGATVKKKSPRRPGVRDLCTPTRQQIGHPGFLGPFRTARDSDYIASHGRMIHDDELKRIQKATIMA
jgi:hypothetical protein